jgi:hypothetical protein
MTNIVSKTLKQIDIASNRYKKDGAVWTIEIMQKMVENAEDYDADVIEEIKRHLKNRHTAS